MRINDWYIIKTEYGFLGFLVYVYESVSFCSSLVSRICFLQFFEFLERVEGSSLFQIILAKKMLTIYF